MNTDYANMLNSQLYIVIAITLFITILSYVISSFGLMKLFEKAGAPKGSAWIPIYNTWVFFQIGGIKGYWSLLFLTAIIPFLGIVTATAGSILMVIAAYNISLGFRKDGTWAVLYFFLGIVWVYILAFDKSIWQGVTGTNAILVKENKYEPTIGYQNSFIAPHMPAYGHNEGGLATPYVEPPTALAVNMESPRVESVPNSTAPIINPFLKKK
jgi:hypothetical protein